MLIAKAQVAVHLGCRTPSCPVLHQGLKCENTGFELSQALLIVCWPQVASNSGTNDLKPAFGRTSALLDF